MSYRTHVFFSQNFWYDVISKNLSVLISGKKYVWQFYICCFTKTFPLIYVASMINLFIYGHGVVIYFLIQSLLEKTAKTHLSARKAAICSLILSTAAAIITQAKSYEHSAMLIFYVVKLNLSPILFVNQSHWNQILNFRYVGSDNIALKSSQTDLYSNEYSWAWNSSFSKWNHA